MISRRRIQKRANDIMNLKTIIPDCKKNKYENKDI